MQLGPFNYNDEFLRDDFFFVRKRENGYKLTCLLSATMSVLMNDVSSREFSN